MGRTFSFVPEDTNFPLYIGRCAYEWRQEEPYDWDGMKRGKTHFILIQWTISGEGCVEWRGNPLRVGPGQAMILQIPDQHRYHLAAPDQHWEFVYVTLYGSETRRLWKPFLSLDSPVIGLERKSMPVSLIFETLRRIHVGEEFSPYRVSSIAYQIFMDLADGLLTRKSDVERSTAILNGLQFCNENFHQPISVGDMARAAGLSRAHFCRRFKVSEGVSPHEYLSFLRVSRGAELLQTNLSVKEIAPLCGFHDVNYFCRVFRRNTGLSPGQYRRTGGVLKNVRQS
ncbi:AraC family transcriptional regulator [Oscillatoria laete-virens NRMC-F 0139]|nr:AraC family transcriptional regulator [Oscillatoria laete-virens NRMC-F 0139]